MATINIEYDDGKVSDEEIRMLSRGLLAVVKKATMSMNMQSVFVYANSARIKLNVYPIEVYVRITAGKIKDREKLLKDIKTGLSDWKKESGFKHNINLTLWPVDWSFEIEI